MGIISGLMSSRILTSGNSIQVLLKIKTLGWPDTQIHAETVCKNTFQPGFRNGNILRFLWALCYLHHLYSLSPFYTKYWYEKNPVTYFSWSIPVSIFQGERKGNCKFWLLAQLLVILKFLTICSSFFSIISSKNTSLLLESSFLGKECGHWNVKRCQQKVVSCSKYRVVIVIFQIQSYNVSAENPNLLLGEIGEQYSSVFL